MEVVERKTRPRTEAGVSNTSDCIRATRVLAVDDESSASKLLALIFAPPAFECSIAHSGEEALVALQRERFDVVISDLRMPGVGGMALLAGARRHHRHVAFLVTAGVDDVEVGVQAMRAGADDYLVKPIAASAVLASVERALHKQHLLVFVSDTEDKQMSEIINRLKGSSALTVGESKDFAERGGEIQFYVEENKVRFSANVDAVQRARLIVSSRLLALARIVHDQDPSKGN